MSVHEIPEFRGATLVDLLRFRALNMPDRIAYRFLEDGEQASITITYGELDQQARAIGARLQQMNAAGERALLLYPPGLDYIATFFGCLYAGVIAAPAYPPRLNRPSPRIQGMVADAGATIALATTSILENIERRFDHMPDLAALNWLNTDLMTAEAADEWREPTITADHLAFLQYTSGSTSAPKGVMVSHGNLIHNLKVIRHGFQIGEAIGVFWLPSYHDMGLIGGVLEPMYINGPSILMSPAAFLQRPIRWLEAISRYGGTISGAPNFAYQMCVDKISEEQKEGLDLSSWDVAFSGAEPIRHETMKAFAKAFAHVGFRSDSFYPCYGLAEGTLLVSGGIGPAKIRSETFDLSALANNAAKTADPSQPGTQTMVSVGQSLLDQEVVIVDPDSLKVCPPGTVGEIWAGGQSVAQGYWGRPAVNERTFQAKTADTGQGPYLRTGDLGFIYDGEIYITGRLKDLIIIRGRNHYPQDIELTVENSHEAFEPSFGAAFSVDVEGEERLVVTYEAARRHRKVDISAVAAAARKAVAQNHQLGLHALVLLKPMSIPKTSSGKVKRHACRLDYLDGSLKVINQWHSDDLLEEEPIEPVEPVETPVAAAVPAIDKKDQPRIQQWLIDRVAVMLKVAPGRIDVREPFDYYGLDSAQAVEMAGDLEQWLGRTLPATLVWDYPNIAELSAYLAGENA
jgi:acyl-CoA synthetase (AMP-forming)/AMP-acid ligase II/acyl carrier protein